MSSWVEESVSDYLNVSKDKVINAIANMERLEKLVKLFNNFKNEREMKRYVQDINSKINPQPEITKLVNRPIVNGGCAPLGTNVIQYQMRNEYLNTRLTVEGNEVNLLFFVFSQLSPLGSESEAIRMELHVAQMGYKHVCCQTYTKNKKNRIVCSSKTHKLKTQDDIDNLLEEYEISGLEQEELTIRSNRDNFKVGTFLSANDSVVVIYSQNSKVYSRSHVYPSRVVQSISNDIQDSTFEKDMRLSKFHLLENFDQEVDVLSGPMITRMFDKNGVNYKLPFQTPISDSFTFLLSSGVLLSKLVQIGQFNLALSPDLFLLAPALVKPWITERYSQRFLTAKGLYDQNVDFPLINRSKRQKIIQAKFQQLRDDQKKKFNWAEFLEHENELLLLLWNYKQKGSLLPRVCRFLVQEQRNSGAPIGIELFANLQKNKQLYKYKEGLREAVFDFYREEAQNNGQLQANFTETAGSTALSTVTVDHVKAALNWEYYGDLAEQYIDNFQIVGSNAYGAVYPYLVADSSTPSFDDTKPVSFKYNLSATTLESAKLSPQFKAPYEMPKISAYSVVSAFFSHYESVASTWVGFSTFFVTIDGLIQQGTKDALVKAEKLVQEVQGLQQDMIDKLKAFSTELSDSDVKYPSQINTNQNFQREVEQIFKIQKSQRYYNLISKIKLNTEQYETQVQTFLSKVTKMSKFQNLTKTYDRKKLASMLIIWFKYRSIWPTKEFDTNNFKTYKSNLFKDIDKTATEQELKSLDEQLLKGSTEATAANDDATTMLSSLKHIAELTSTVAKGYQEVKKNHERNKRIKYRNAMTLYRAGATDAPPDPFLEPTEENSWLINQLTNNNNFNEVLSAAFASGSLLVLTSVAEVFSERLAKLLESDQVQAATLNVLNYAGQAFLSEQNKQLQESINDEKVRKEENEKLAKTLTEITKRNSARAIQSSEWIQSNRNKMQSITFSTAAQNKNKRTQMYVTALENLAGNTIINPVQAMEQLRHSCLNYFLFSQPYGLDVPILANKSLQGAVGKASLSILSLKSPPSQKDINLAQQFIFRAPNLPELSTMQSDIFKIFLRLTLQDINLERDITSFITDFLDTKRALASSHGPDVDILLLNKQSLQFNTIVRQIIRTFNSLASSIDLSLYLSDAQRTVLITTCVLKYEITSVSTWTAYNFALQKKQELSKYMDEYSFIPSSESMFDPALFTLPIPAINLLLNAFQRQGVLNSIGFVSQPLTTQVLVSVLPYFLWSKYTDKIQYKVNNTKFITNFNGNMDTYAKKTFGLDSDTLETLNKKPQTSWYDWFYNLYEMDNLNDEVAAKKNKDLVQMLTYGKLLITNERVITFNADDDAFKNCNSNIETFVAEMSPSQISDSNTTSIYSPTAVRLQNTMLFDLLFNSIEGTADNKTQIGWLNPLVLNSKDGTLGRSQRAKLKLEMVIAERELSDTPSAVLAEEEYVFLKNNANFTGEAKTVDRMKLEYENIYNELMKRIESVSTISRVEFDTVYTGFFETVGTNYRKDTEAWVLRSFLGYATASVTNKLDDERTRMFTTKNTFISLVGRVETFLSSQFEKAKLNQATVRSNLKSITSPRLSEEDINMHMQIYSMFSLFLISSTYNSTTSRPREIFDTHLGLIESAWCTLDNPELNGRSLRSCF